VKSPPRLLTSETPTVGTVTGVVNVEPNDNRKKKFVSEVNERLPADLELKFDKYGKLIGAHYEDEQSKSGDY
jgi:hypothetical protein